jgi:hypothetical protein
MTTPWYTDSEINDLCVGLFTNAAKVRHLRSLGLTVHQKPNGCPLVMRAHAESVLSGAAEIKNQVINNQKATPNVAQFRQSFGKTMKTA